MMRNQGFFELIEKVQWSYEEKLKIKENNQSWPWNTSK